MITLKEWMEVADYRITEGNDYQWECYGPNAYSLDSWNGDQNGYSFCVYFDTKTQEVYEVQAHDYRNSRAYRLINPVFVKQYKKETKKRQLEFKEAYDDVEYTDLETDDDWIQKALSIKSGEDYDTRVEVPLILDKEQMFELMSIAHEQDLTLNQLVEHILRDKILDETIKNNKE
jgi:hypothetical protein